jgi:proteasome accessory factor B
MSAVKLERLLNLTAALLGTPRPLTAEQVRERVPGYPAERVAFRRAFERDKDDLRELGIPLRVERVEVDAGAREGYRIPPEEYYLSDPGLDADELAALHLATRVVRLEGATEALWKLGGEAGDAGEGSEAGESAESGQASAAAPVATDPALAGVSQSALSAAPLAEVPTDERLTSLFTGLVERRAVHFSYPGGRGDTEGMASGSGSGSGRTVEPHRLEFQRGRWYLSGHDRDRDAPRSFRVDRILGAVEVLAVTFPAPSSRHPGVRLQPWELGDEQATTARLLVDPEQAAWAIQHLGPEAVESRRPDGSAVLRIGVTNRPAFRSFVLTFLDHAEVLSPPELRREVVEWLEGMAAGRTTGDPGASA